MTPDELAALDLAVAKAEGFAYAVHYPAAQTFPGNVVVRRTAVTDEPEQFRPTTDLALALRLLEKHALNLGRSKYGWWAWRSSDNRYTRPSETPAIAICRAVVALKGTA